MTISPASSASDELLERVRANLASVRDRIERSGRDARSVRVVAVTKTFDVTHVAAALALGLTSIGENYVDELCEKRRAMSAFTASWHFLGPLQSNKITRAVRCADVLSSVARVKELEKIAALSPGQVIDVQVDFGDDPGRNGVAPGDVGEIVRRARALELQVRGLMVVAPQGEKATRQAFLATNALAEEWDLRERSMGMSDDLELACELGTTEVRLGRALFGPRSSEGRLA
jgi:pyridoxal phosphate enzyme (YggS family)